MPEVVSGLRQLTWYLTPHSRTGAFALDAAASATRNPLARGALAPHLTNGAAYF